MLTYSTYVFLSLATSTSWKEGWVFITCLPIARDWAFVKKISTVTDLGLYGWRFSIEHFSNRFSRLKRGNSYSERWLFNRFNLVWGRFKTLANQTNRKRFFPSRTLKNPTNQIWLIPIEHDPRVGFRPTNDSNALTAGFREILNIDINLYFKFPTKKIIIWITPSVLQDSWTHSFTIGMSMSLACVLAAVKWSPSFEWKDRTSFSVKRKQLAAMVFACYTINAQKNYVTVRIWCVREVQTRKFSDQWGTDVFA